MRTGLLLGLGAFSVAYLITFVLTPFSARAARRLGILDRPHIEPKGHKQHAMATPYLGGLAIMIGVLLGAVPLALARGGADLGTGRRLTQVVAIAVALGLIGLLDDIWMMPRSIRLLAQLGAAWAAWELDFKVTATHLPLLDLALTVVWIVGITNAFNLLDNMDGLSAGLAGVGALSFTLLGAANSLFLVTVGGAAVAGSALGFVAHNRHPAKVFMGDAGSIFLGYMLALLGISLRFDNLVEVTFLVPVVVLGIPILDTTLVVLARLKNQRPVFLGARDHISHRLAAIGLPVRSAVWLLCWAGLCLGWLGFVISESTPKIGFMLLGFVVALGIFFGSILWRIPVYVAQLSEPEHEEAEPPPVAGRAPRQQAR